MQQVLKRATTLCLGVEKEEQVHWWREKGRIPGIGRTGLRRMKEQGVFKEQQKVQCV